jgi:hypothetical protein
MIHIVPSNSDVAWFKRYSDGSIVAKPMLFLWPSEAKAKAKRARYEQSKTAVGPSAAGAGVHPPVAPPIADNDHPNNPPEAA